jgi:hypothetical protein
VLWLIELRISRGRNVYTQEYTINSNSWTSNWQLNLFSKKNPIIRIFCVPNGSASKLIWTNEVLLYLVIMKNGERFTWQIKWRIAMTKTALNKYKALFTSKLDSNWRKKLIKCRIGNAALYGVETWALRKVDQ